MIVKRLAVILAFAAVITAGIAARVGNIDGDGNKSPDEAVYTAQAKHLTGGKIIVTRGLVKTYNADKNKWLYPNPMRIGYLWPLSYFMEATGLRDYRAGSYISVFCSIVSLILVVFFGLRYFNKWIALYAVLALAASPMELAVSIRAWQDAVCGCLGLGLIFLTAVCVKAKGRLTLLVPFVLAGTYYFMVKEAGVLLYLLCLLWLLSSLAREKMFYRMLSAFILVLISAAAGVSFMAYALGGIGNMLEVIKHISEAMPFNDYAVCYQSGPWHNVICGLFILSPVNVLLCFAGIAGFVFYRRESCEGGLDREISFWLMVILAVYVIVMTWMPFCQNIRYLSPVYGVFYLVAGIGAWYIYIYLRSKLKGGALKAAVCLIAAVTVYSAASDYAYFRKALHDMEIVDITIKALESRPRF